MSLCQVVVLEASVAQQGDLGTQTRCLISSSCYTYTETFCVRVRECSVFMGCMSD